ncbi:mechanosensitive ion channel family protein [Parabacteroides sp. OttesenSCG-928-G07]|nr:mechanosensitive ion channel family protein [Parabacteroides sp. OttesenSCG-928-G21]MDL2278909.1 mechanosensitive ion channel family protein [Parabacteroides sp. OttesenSCG-928-G07]
MHLLKEWINAQLLNLGLPEKTAGILDNITIFILILLFAFLIDIILRKTIVGVFRRVAGHTKNDWDDLILERGIIHKVIRIVPLLFIYVMLPLSFTNNETSVWLLIAERVCLVAIIAISIRFLNALLDLVNDLYNRRQSGKSIKGFIQVVQIVFICIGLILMIGILFDKSVGSLIAGLGASAAVLMLIFKDSILGFVAGIQLSSNDMLRTGDWITMPKYGADGTVIDVTLNAVKVRNFDNTIVTIPPYSLVSDSFQNWRGMTDSGGRRIKRSISIDMNSVKFCTPEMLEKFRKIEILREYIDEKENELKSYNEEHKIDNAIKVNGRRQTNLGVFRAYIERYLKAHPNVSKKHTCMVRQLQPTEKGIPVELYLFLSEIRWVYYEGIQADIFDHLLAVVPEFDLEVYQNISGSDMRRVRG